MPDRAAKHCFFSKSAWRVLSWVKGGGKKRGPCGLQFRNVQGEPWGLREEPDYSCLVQQQH